MKRTITQNKRIHVQLWDRSIAHIECDTMPTTVAVLIAKIAQQHTPLRTQDMAMYHSKDLLADEKEIDWELAGLSDSTILSCKMTYYSFGGAMKIIMSPPSRKNIEVEISSENPLMTIEQLKSAFQTYGESRVRLGETVLTDDTALIYTLLCDNPEKSMVVEVQKEVVYSVNSKICMLMMRPQN